MSASASRTDSAFPWASSTLVVTGVDRHARADGRLRQVYRGDVAALEVSQGGRQFGLEGTSTNSRRVAMGASAGRRRQTRTMLEARAFDCYSCTGFFPRFQYVHRPCAGDGEAGERMTASRKVSQPVLEAPASPFWSPIA